MVSEKKTFATLKELLLVGASISKRGNVSVSKRSRYYQRPQVEIVSEMGLSRELRKGLNFNCQLIKD